MEFVVVRFAGDREVLIDGLTAGKTNRLLMVEEGNHVFHLAGPEDYLPLSRTLTLRGTRSGEPCVIEFSPTGFP